MPILKNRPKQRFLAKVQQSSSGCWLWQGALNDESRGSFYYDGQQKLAHRAAYELFVGVIPDGLQINHICDNPQCVNPKHLYAGTQQNNIQDCVSRGRIYRRHGEANSNARLTKAVVLAMRQAYATGNYRLCDLAIQYGVHTSHVWRIVNKVQWNMEENA